MLLGALPPVTMGYEQMFPKTKPGEIEIKTLPKLRALKHSKGTGDYFNESNDLFMPLFRYIQQNDLAMTIPVESEINPATMIFFVGPDVDLSRTDSSEHVEVLTIPERTVLAVGIRGSYNDKNYQQALSKAPNWLKQDQQYTANGPARMIYWDGPYIPWFLKRSELHLPIVER